MQFSALRSRQKRVQRVHTTTCSKNLRLDSTWSLATHTNPKIRAKNNLLDAVLLTDLHRWRFAPTNLRFHCRRAASFAENGQRRGTAQCPNTHSLSGLWGQLQVRVPPLRISYVPEIPLDGKRDDKCHISKARAATMTFFVSTSITHTLTWPQTGVSEHHGIFMFIILRTSWRCRDTPLPPLLDREVIKSPVAKQVLQWPAPPRTAALHR